MPKQKPGFPASPPESSGGLFAPKEDDPFGNFKYAASKSYLSDNSHTKLVDLTIRPSKLTALYDKIHAQPYPGINTRYGQRCLAADELEKLPATTVLMPPIMPLQ